MKLTRSIFAVTLLAGALFAPTIRAWEPLPINGDFEDGLEDWTPNSSFKLVPNIVSPILLGPGTANETTLWSGAAPLYLTSPDFSRFAFLTTLGAPTAASLTQTFRIALPTEIPGKLGRGVGRLQLSDYGGYGLNAHLKFQARFFTNEAFGTPFQDFFRATLNGETLAFARVNDTAALPAGSAFARATPWLEIESGVTSL